MHEPELELEIALRSLDQWRALREAQPWVADPASAKAIVERAMKHGIDTAPLGHVPAAALRVTGANFRENFHAHGLNPRLRAVLECLVQRTQDAEPNALRIYAPEAVTPFARFMAARYPGFEGSEYLPEAARRARLPDVTHQDLEALDYRDGRFDAVLCNEVFEHLPRLDRAIGELARVIRSGGWLISTFPFAYEREQAIVKATLENGELHHLEAPEYHDDPVSGTRGALVYAIPAWDIIGRVEAAGFESAEMVFLASARRGLCARDLAGVFVLCAQR